MDYLSSTFKNEIIMIDMRNFCKGLFVFGTI